MRESEGNPYFTFGQLLVGFRKTNQLSQTQLAEAINTQGFQISRQVISRMESGIRHPPKEPSFYLGLMKLSKAEMDDVTLGFLVDQLDQKSARANIYRHMYPLAGTIDIDDLRFTVYSRDKINPSGLAEIIESASMFFEWRARRISDKFDSFRGNPDTFVKIGTISGIKCVIFPILPIPPRG